MRYKVLLGPRGDGVTVAADSFKETETGLELLNAEGKLVASFRNYVGIVPVINKEEK